MKHIATIVEESVGKPLEADLVSPYRDLNEMLQGGFFYGHITTIAGRTSMGKSAIAVEILTHTAHTLGLPSVYFSAEMTAKQLGGRVGRIVTGGDPRPEASLELIEHTPLYIDDRPGTRPNMIREVITELNEQLAPGRIHQACLDFIQLARPESGYYENRNREIESIMQDMLAIAKEFNLHFINLSQINRGPEYRKHESGSARPELSDLRDSGTLENNSNEVILLYRPGYYEEFKTGDSTTELIVAKQREGPTGTVILDFDPEQMSFHDRY